MPGAGIAPAGLHQHQLNAAFPAMRPVDFAALRNSVAGAGVLRPITIYQGQVLDGWHRYLVASRQGISCPMVELPEGVDPRGFVIDQNAERSHGTPAERFRAVQAVRAWRPAEGGQ